MSVAVLEVLLSNFVVSVSQEPFIKKFSYWDQGYLIVSLHSMTSAQDSKT